MLARDVMVSPVITVGVDATVRDVAKTLLENCISAVPVIDLKGKLAGIVTESDLMHRAEAGTERRHSWWLEALQGDFALATDYVKSHSAKVSDLMTRDVVTASPETPLHEIAALLEKRQIKRVPIMSNNDELVGIVSRANLLQAVATAQPKLDLQLPDAAIRQKIVDHLKKQRWTHAYNLNVTVANGVVDLWGVIDFRSGEKGASRRRRERVRSSEGQ